MRVQQNWLTPYPVLVSGKTPRRQVGDEGMFVPCVKPKPVQLAFSDLCQLLMQVWEAHVGGKRLGRGGSLWNKPALLILPPLGPDLPTDPPSPTQKHPFLLLFCLLPTYAPLSAELATLAAAALDLVPERQHRPSC